MIPKRSRPHYKKHKEHARALVHERLAHWNSHYGFTVRKVFIKNHKSRWGSCSARGNLNFSYRIVFLPPEIVDYIIVHELCHLQEFNHSPRFWALVEKALPKYRTLRHRLRELERNSQMTIRRKIINLEFLILNQFQMIEF